MADESTMAAALNASSFQFTDADGNILILNTVLGTFEHAAHDGFTNLMPEAMWLVGVFSIINICTTWALYDGELRLSQMITQVMKIGAFLFLIMNMGKINQAIMLSFQHGGIIAALGPSAASTYTGFTPSGLLDKGVELTKDLWTSNAFEYGIEGTIQKIIVVLLVIFSYFIMSIQLLLTKIEFNIFAAIAVILLPFGALRYTSFLFQRAVSCVFSFGIKLMLCYFMLGIVERQSDALLKGFEYGGKTPEFGMLISSALGYVAIGYLVWKVPTVVSGMMNGQPSLEGTGMARGAGGLAVGAASAAIGGLPAAAGYAKATLGAARANAIANYAGPSVVAGPGGSMKPGTPGNLAVAAEFVKQLKRQTFASTPYAQGMIRGANKAIGLAQDSSALRSGGYARKMQSNRNR